jgi:hypothetical protein
LQLTLILRRKWQHILNMNDRFFLHCLKWSRYSFLMLYFFVQSFLFTTGETKAVKPKELDK